MEALTAKSLLSRSPDLLEATVDDETVLMSVQRGNYYGLARTAHEIWGRLATPTKLDALSAALAAEFDAPPERIAADILPFLDKLIAEGLVIVTPDA
jgi:hypothetical protein